MNNREVDNKAEKKHTKIKNVRTSIAALEDRRYSLEIAY